MVFIIIFILIFNIFVDFKTTLSCYHMKLEEGVFGIKALPTLDCD